MLKRIKKLYQLLSNEQRKKLLRLQVLVVLMAFAEVAGVASIGPFMAVVGDRSLLEGEGALAEIYQISGYTIPNQFLFWLGIAVLAALSVATAVSMFTVWRLSIYAQQVGAELTVRLYKHYMQQPWLFHASVSSSQLINRIASDSGRVTNTIVQPIIQMIAKGIMALTMAVGIFIFNPVVASAILFIFGVAYFVLFRTVRKQLSRNGAAISKTNQQRFKLMNEGFGGIKDTLLLGRQADFNRRFQLASFQLALAQGSNRALSQSPRYLMELISFGVVVFLILYLIEEYKGDLGNILPVLSVYALAGFKLLPAFQQIYSSLATVKSSLASFDNLEKDLVDSVRSCDSDSKFREQAEKLSPRTLIKLSNVHLSYPGKKEKALAGLNIDIPINQVTGFVGASGSGKSTAVDVLLGLIEPQQGGLVVDEQKLQGEQLRAWQNNVGFVPQTIFLADASIKENIAFGLPLEKIDIERVKNAAKMAHLDELIERLPEGIETQVGERGVQLSGGQRQRIGIARALYDDAEVLVLDEATSALDGITEKLIMDAIHDFSGKKTIIMIAHRLATVRKCNQIYLFDNGNVISSGSYEQLKERSPIFRDMSLHS